MTATDGYASPSGQPTARAGRLRRLVAGFRAGRGGGVAILFALALPPLLGVVGSAVDYTFASQAKARLDAVDFVWAPVQTPAEAVADPQLAAAGGFVEIACRDGGAIKSPASPVRFSQETGEPIAAAPTPGEHTHEILAELGYGAGAIAELIDSGAAKTGT